MSTGRAWPSAPLVAMMSVIGALPLPIWCGPQSGGQIACCIILQPIVWHTCRYAGPLDQLQKKSEEFEARMVSHSPAGSWYQHAPLLHGTYQNNLGAEAAAVNGWLLPGLQPQASAPVAGTCSLLFHERIPFRCRQVQREERWARVRRRRLMPRLRPAPPLASCPPRAGVGHGQVHCRCEYDWLHGRRCFMSCLMYHHGPRLSSVQHSDGQCLLAELVTVIMRQC